MSTEVTEHQVAHHVGARRHCATCPARVFSYADGAPGVHYCRVCVRLGYATDHARNGVELRTMGSTPAETFPAGARVRRVARKGDDTARTGVVHTAPDEHGTALVLWDGGLGPVAVGAHLLDRSL